MKYVAKLSAYKNKNSKAKFDVGIAEIVARHRMRVVKNGHNQYYGDRCNPGFNWPKNKMKEKRHQDLICDSHITYKIKGANVVD